MRPGTKLSQFLRYSLSTLVLSIRRYVLKIMALIHTEKYCKVSEAYDKVKEANI